MTNPPQSLDSCYIMHTLIHQMRLWHVIQQASLVAGAGLDPSLGAPAESGFGSPVALASALQPAGSAAVVTPAAVRQPAIAGDDASPEGGVITSPWNDEDEVLSRLPLEPCIVKLGGLPGKLSSFSRSRCFMQPGSLSKCRLQISSSPVQVRPF